MKFTKMQGLGNDYVYVNCLEETVEHPAETAVKAALTVFTKDNVITSLRFAAGLTGGSVLLNLS